MLGVLPQALLLFAAVAWHEGCHAVVAWYLGWRVNSIELFPFGGVARLRRTSGKKQEDEALIAIVGPAASLSLALLLIIVSTVCKLEPAWLAFFIRVNFILGLFNLWPGLPLDGGRIYRVWRARRKGWAQATLEAIYGGQVLAVILGLGSIGGYFLRLVDLQGLALAIFIYYAAKREKREVPYMFWRDFWRWRSGDSSSQVNKVFWLAAEENFPLTKVVRFFASRAFNLVAVVNAEGKIIGLLTEKEIMQVLMAGNTGVVLKELLTE